jgi:hypothetical protein
VDPIHGKRGKQRSVHNTYFTLPVLFAMLSNHYGFLYHQQIQLAGAHADDAGRRADPPVLRAAPLGLQHVLVMYAGAVAVPLIVGRALKLSPEQVAMLISADLFCCGLVTLIQSLGATQWFGIKLPVMMGVTFASGHPWWRWPTATRAWRVPASSSVRSSGPG